MTQAQDSLTDQLLRVVQMAEDAGEYDAAGWIKYRMVTSDHLSDINTMQIPQDWFRL